MDCKGTLISEFNFLWCERIGLMESIHLQGSLVH